MFFNGQGDAKGLLEAMCKGKLVAGAFEAECLMHEGLFERLFLIGVKSQTCLIHDRPWEEVSIYLGSFSRSSK